MTAPHDFQTADLFRDLHAHVAAWYDRHRDPATPPTPAYFRLVFAWGLARVGAADAAAEFRHAAAAELSGKGDVHVALLAGFGYRIDQALAGRPLSGPLPTYWAERLDSVDRARRYVVDRMRESSQILEPKSRVDSDGPIDGTVAGQRLRTCELAELLDCLRAWLNDKQVARDPRRAANLVRIALQRPDADRKVVRSLLGLVCERTAETIWTYVQGNGAEGLHLHHEAVEAACRHGLREEFLALLAAFLDVYRSLSFAVALPALLRAHVRALFRLGLCEEADQTLAATSEAMRAGRPMEEWLATGDSGDQFRLRTALALANGWNAFGWWPLSRPVLEHALKRADPASGLEVRRRAQITREAVESFWLADRPFAREGLAWLLARMPDLPDRSTVGGFYAEHALGLVECVVTTAVEVCCRD